MQTFMKPQSDKLTMARAEYTISFMEGYITNETLCLDIAEPSPVGNRIASFFKFQINNTQGDLDYNFLVPETRKHEVVICLEVMEHLMSPKFFLLELKKYITPEAKIFFSYPSRPKFWWTSQHFHEYDRKRFTYLLNHCGYEIIDWQRKKFKRTFLSYFKGLRTPFRIFFDWDNLVYARLKEGK